MTRWLGFLWLGHWRTARYRHVGVQVIAKARGQSGLLEGKQVVPLQPAVLSPAPSSKLLFFLPKLSLANTSHVSLWLKLLPYQLLRMLNFSWQNISILHHHNASSNEERKDTCRPHRSQELYFLRYTEHSPVSAHKRESKLEIGRKFNGKSH